MGYHQHSRQAAADQFDSQAKNKTMMRMNGIAKVAQATLDSNLTIKDGRTVREPRILNKTMPLGDHGLRQKLGHLRMVDFV